MNRSLPVLLSLALLAGCGSNEGHDATRMLGSRIVGGERSSADDDAVVRLLEVKDTKICSGALVAPNLVLTAAHCVVQHDVKGKFACDTRGVLNTESPPDGSLGVPAEPSDIQVFTGATPARTATASARGTKIFSSGSTVICRNDIAFLVLDTDLDQPILPLRLDRPVKRGETMRAVGYGQTSESGSSGRYSRSGVIVNAVGSDGTRPASGLAGPNTIVLGPGACHGDSGGPAISEETGAATGVYSVSDGVNCEVEQVRNVYTQVAPFTALAAKAFAYAGHEPLPEVIPDTGAAGASGASGAEPPVDAAGGQASGGASSESGGSSQSGGSTGTGDTGSGAESASGGSRAVDGGSGARRDSSCSVRGVAANPQENAVILSAALLAGLSFVRRRQRTRERSSSQPPERA